MRRRDFLKAPLGAAALAGLTANDPLLASLAEKPPRVGLIGCGWYGKCDLLRLIQTAPVDVVALCDVDRNMLKEAADLVATRQKSGKTPRTYGDYREMLKNKDLDIVLIGTPDHWHALTAIAAMEAGADVYVQKPISVDVVEGQAMVAAARALKRVVQVGTQRRSTPHLMQAKKEIIETGLLGKIKHVELYCYYHMRARETPPDQPPPDYLDYDLWTGPAPLLPFNSLTHPRRWRAFMEYGNGIIGDMCIHMYDMARWMLGVGWPVRVSSNGGIFVDPKSRANITDTQTAIFDHGDLTMVWQHRTWGSTPDPKYPWGATFYGDKGTLKASVMGYDFTPQGPGASKHVEVAYELDQYPEDKTEKDLERHVAPAIRVHMRDFLARIADRGRPVADIEEGHISSASCILANMALKLGRTLAWDPHTQTVLNDPEANALLKRPYRAGWVHPLPTMFVTTS